MSSGPTQKAEAVSLQGVHCTFASPPLQTVGPNSVTCTFTLRGNDHTLVVDFTVDLSARPPLTIDGCTLDGNAIHRGPCP